jgi:hypothetical protein
MSPSLSKPDSQPHLPGFLHQRAPTFPLLSRTPVPFQFLHLRSHQCLHHPTSIPPVSLPHPPTFPPPSRTPIRFPFLLLCSHRCLRHPTSILLASLPHPRMMTTLSAGRLCRHWHLPVLLQTPPLMHMTCCGLRDVSTSQNITAHGRLGCMHEIWHGHLPICRGPTVMLRYTFVKFSLVLHGSRRLTTDTKTPFLDQCPPKSRSVGHCPDQQVAYGPIGSQLQQAGRSSLPRIRRAPKSKVYIVTDTIVL